MKHALTFYSALWASEYILSCYKTERGSDVLYTLTILEGCLSWPLNHNVDLLK